MVHALYQIGPPCNCDLRSICNLTTPGAWLPLLYSTVAAYRVSIRRLYRTNNYITTHRGSFDQSDLRETLPLCLYMMIASGYFQWPTNRKSQLTHHDISRCFPCLNMCAMHKRGTYMLVLAVEVSHSPARPIMSKPEDSWLKKRGWPKCEKQRRIKVLCKTFFLGARSSKNAE